MTTHLFYEKNDLSKSNESLLSNCRAGIFHKKKRNKRHAAIWPELKQMIKDQGVSDYSIFWDK